MASEQSGSKSNLKFMVEFKEESRREIYPEDILTVNREILNHVEKVYCFEYVKFKSERVMSESPGYDTQPPYVVSRVLVFDGIWSIHSFILLQSSRRHGVIVSVKVPSMGQIKLFDNLLNL